MSAIQSGNVLRLKTYTQLCFYVLCGQENVEYFNYFGSLIISDARHTREIQSRIIMEKAAFNKNETLFTGILDFKLKRASSRGLQWEHGFVWR
jgi:hypothetical protein